MNLISSVFLLTFPASSNLLRARRSSGSFFIISLLASFVLMLFHCIFSTFFLVSIKISHIQNIITQNKNNFCEFLKLVKI
jgi:hypothetical protein